MHLPCVMPVGWLQESVGERSDRQMGRRLIGAVSKVPTVSLKDCNYCRVLFSHERANGCPTFTRAFPVFWSRVNVRYTHSQRDENERKTTRQWSGWKSCACEEQLLCARQRLPAIIRLKRLQNWYNNQRKLTANERVEPKTWWCVPYNGSMFSVGRCPMSVPTGHFVRKTNVDVFPTASFVAFARGNYTHKPEITFVADPRLVMTRPPTSSFQQCARTHAEAPN